jgi:DNA-binding NarL/FixJ family response regulator
VGERAIATGHQLGHSESLQSGTAEGASSRGSNVGGPGVAQGDLTRVLVVDDHTIFADLLAYSIDAEDDFVCVGRAATVAQAVALTDALAPDIVVMDIGLPDGDGVEATARIVEQHPEVRVLILTGSVDQNLFARAARAGAIAFLGKYDPLHEVLATLRGARAGAVIINNTLLSLLMSPTPDEQATSGDVPALTALERDILGLLAEGHDTARIARILSITMSTCRGQLRSLREKLDARTQLEVVVKATRAGLLPSAFAQPAFPRVVTGGRPVGSH